MPEQQPSIATGASGTGAGGTTPNTAGDQIGTTGSGEFKGRYTTGFETSEFIVCDTQERWWLTGNLKEIFAATQPVPRGTMQTLFVHVAGQVTGLGRYGHLGRYQRQLSVQRVVLARESRPDDCK
jgi:hypothetical protein